MSGVVPAHEVVVVRQDDAEMPGGPPVTGRLYADSSATGGALSSQRITLANGAAGATPHHRTGSSELFYVLSGSAELLAGERVRTARQGDLVVVPPGTVDRFRGRPGHRRRPADHHHARSRAVRVLQAPAADHDRRGTAGEHPRGTGLLRQSLRPEPAWQQALAARRKAPPAAVRLPGSAVRYRPRGRVRPGTARNARSGPQ